MMTDQFKSLYAAFKTKCFIFVWKYGTQHEQNSSTHKTIWHTEKLKVEAIHSFFYIKMITYLSSCNKDCITANGYRGQISIQTKDMFRVVIHAFENNHTSNITELMQLQQQSNVSVSVNWSGYLNCRHLLSDELNRHNCYSKVLFN